MTDKELSDRYFEDIYLRHNEKQIKVEHRDPALFKKTQEDVCKIKIKNLMENKKELSGDIERLRIVLAESLKGDFDFFNDIYQQKKQELDKINYSLSYLKKIISGEIDEKQKFDLVRLKEIPIDTIVEVNSALFFKIRDEKTPSAYWYKNTNRWTDFGSGESGDTIDLVMKLQNIDFYKACQFLSYRSG
jgi:hypothetical protein